MKIIYIVEAWCGRDEPQWMVTAYPDKEAAQLHVEKANDWVENVLLKASINDRRKLWTENPWDNNEGYDNVYYIPDYSVVSVSVSLHPDEYQENKHERRVEIAD